MLRIYHDTSVLTITKIPADTFRSPRRCRIAVGDEAQGLGVGRERILQFRRVRTYKSGDIDWPTFQALMSPIRETTNDLLQRGAFSGNRRLVGMCQELHNHREWLWTFVEHEGIEPTNNTAERGLRPAVIYRKLSFGTNSESGSRFLERIHTVSETCRLQNRSIDDYLVTAVQAHFKQQPIPSLLPCS